MYTYTDVTTVLLVDNNNRSSHGRFLNVRPAVGLLTSTARTFIQEGVTTEYATQVLGTTLEQGRLYAQLLTRSSRVLYHNENSGSSINPMEHSNVHYVAASQLPQHGLSDRNFNNYHDEENVVTFIRNTDYISPSDPSKANYLYSTVAAANTRIVGANTDSGHQKSESLPENLTLNKEDIVRESFSVSKSSSSKGKSNINDTTNVDVAPNKVKSDLDLPTFTVKNEFAADGLSWIASEALSNVERHDDNAVDGIETKVSASESGQPNRVGKKLYNILDDLRHLTSVTYYGFADFTTIVGNTVIVFSPNTAAPANFGQITSIKGQATLHEKIKPTSSVRATQIIQPTQIAVTENFGILEKNKLKYVDAVRSSSSSSSSSPNVIRNGKANAENDEVDEQTTVSDASEEATTINSYDDASTERLPTDKLLFEENGKSSKPNGNFNADTNIEASEVSISSSTASTPLLSIPSNEDIARIFASLAGKSAKNDDSSESNASADDNETRILEGVTTIFFEDDPFAALESSTVDAVISATKVEEITVVPTATAEISSEEIADFTTELSLETTEASTESITENSPSEITTELDVANEAVTEHSVSIPDENNAIECPDGFVLEPSTLHKTLTYLTTFFIPTDDGESTTMSIESNRVTSTEIHNECSRTEEIVIAPTTVDEETKVLPTQTSEAPVARKVITKINRPFKSIERVESTTTSAPTTTTTEEQPTDAPTVKSAEIDETTEDVSTSDLGETDRPEVVANSDENLDGDEIELIYKTLYTTYTYLTTFFHESTSSVSSRKEVVTNIVTSTLDLAAVSDLFENAPAVMAETIRPTLADIGGVKSTDAADSREHISDIFDEGAIISNIHQATPSLGGSHTDNGDMKTYYTTYTYFTTIFVDGQTEISSRTEVYTNYVGDSVTPTQVIDEYRTVSPDASLINSGLNDIKRSDVESNTEMTESDELLDNNVISQRYKTVQRGGDSTLQVGAGEVIVKGHGSEVNMEMSSSSSSSESDSKPVESNNNPKIVILEDQISSESNKEEILPSPTLLLQTSYTTFTYFTTMYHGSTSSDILSRLETVTNVATETLQPTQAVKAADETADPITYFTTFTYWTTLYKDSEITTVSREEVISHVVEPTKSVKPEDQTVNAITVSIEPNAHLKHDLLSSLNAIPVRDDNDSNVVLVTPVYASSATEDTSHDIEITPTATVDNEQTTYYTTYTYFTTSYIGDETVLKSRFETVTNVISPSVTSSPKVAGSAAGRAINLDKSNINEFIDLKQEKKIKANLAQAPPSAAAPLEKIVSINQGKIVDSEGISTILYTTKVLETKDANNKYSLVTQSTSSVKVDEVKKLLSSERAIGTESTGKHYKTGLVRQIDGTIVANHTTTIYQSKVIGTLIENRYAQIIESTSRFIIDKTQEPAIEPTKVLQDIQATAAPINPTPAVIESSVSDDQSEDVDSHNDQDTDEEEDDGEEEYDSNGGKKSRLSFASRKRTFTPVIRPFASRNRPTFNPKRKNVNSSSATIITRSDFTPTITATPAIKAESSTRGRFGSGSRRSSSSLVSISLPSAQPSGSRRFSRPRPTSVISSLASTHSGPSSSRIRSSSVRPTASIVPGPSSRRTGSPFRPSSSLGARLSILPSQSRFRISPTAALNKAVTPTASKAIEPVDNNETSPLKSDDSTDTVDTDDEEDIDDDANTTTTENSRRNANPLLRFRRPPGARFTPSTTVRTPANNPVVTRRSPLSQRAKNNSATTTTTTTTPKPKARSFQPRPPAVGLTSNRPRVGGNNLFPPRGLLRSSPEKEDANNIAIDDHQEDEDGDDDESDDIVTRSARDILKRHKRQVDYGMRYNSRYRRPVPAQQQQIARSYDEYDQIEDIEYTTSPKPKISSRYSSRQRAAPQANNNENNNDKSNLNSSPKIASNNNNRIRPTAAIRSQFTLRNEKENVYTPPARSSNFRRQPTNNAYSSAARRKPLPTSAARSKTSRPRNYGGFTPTDTRNSRSRGGSTVTNTRARTTNIRPRSRLGYDANEYQLEPSFNGLITVTHHVPTEVTIPVISGQVTEYKNVITAKVSTEILGPNDYSTTVRPNGVNMLVLTNEITNINQKNGATEITQFVLRETSTSSISFTPTTIRGRKTSFSHIVPSTVYNVETVVSTIQPNIAANAPLANILLSQLLLNNLNLNNQQNALLGLTAAQQQQQVSVGVPSTEFKVRTTSYVTTVTNVKSTVVPLTFRGAKILTTVVDSSVDVITATEFITDTIVITPTATAQPQQFNSLLLPLLLQQQQQQQQAQAQQASPLDALNLQQDSLLSQDTDTQGLIGKKNINPTDIDDNHDIQDAVYEDDEEEQSEDTNEESIQKLPLPSRSAQNTSKRKNNKPLAAKQVLDTSVITLYVSGKRPGEFSTVLSTVTQASGSDSTQLQKRAIDFARNGYHSSVRSSSSAILADFYSAEGSDFDEFILPGADFNALESSPSDDTRNSIGTQSLESIIGDVSEYIQASSAFYGNVDSPDMQSTVTSNTNAYTNVSDMDEQKPLSF